MLNRYFSTIFGFILAEISIGIHMRYTASRYRPVFAHACMCVLMLL